MTLASGESGLAAASSAAPPQLTYCTNIHPGESWREVEAVLRTDVRAVKALVSPDAPFGVGLRLAALACRELEASRALPELRAAFAEQGLFVSTLNGFPFGTFHGTRVKEEVYRPDWLEPERVAYTRSLARVLTALLPEDGRGSISTVPGCFRARAEDPTARGQIARAIAESAADLVAIARDAGRHVVLALEPEPACIIETSRDAIAFFEEHLFAPATLAWFAERVGVDARRAEELLRAHVGVCLDTCHASVEFDPPRRALRRLLSAGLAVPKVQVSAGLVVARADADALAALAAFAEDTYLHQVVVRTGQGLVHFDDLHLALTAATTLPPEAEWRIHFHVPVFAAHLDPFSSTQDELRALLTAPDLRAHDAVWEVETYTFGVLPERHRKLGVHEAIARELAWTRAALAAEPATDRTSNCESSSEP